MHHQFEGRVHLKQESVSLFTQPNAIPKILNSKMTKVVHYIPSLLKLYSNFLCEKVQNLSCYPSEVSNLTCTSLCLNLLCRNVRSNKQWHINLVQHFMQNI